MGIIGVAVVQIFFCMPLTFFSVQSLFGDPCFEAIACTREISGDGMAQNWVLTIRKETNVRRRTGNLFASLSEATLKGGEEIVEF